MPYKDASARLRASAESMREMRLYRAAVAAGDPKALTAERQRELAENPMRPANELRDRIAAMPTREERQAHKIEYLAVVAKCQAVDRDAARAEYKRLRAEVIKDAQLAALLA